MTRYTFWIVLAAALVTHVVTVFYFASPGVIFGDEPIGNLSYEQRSCETLNVTVALDNDSEYWAYSPRMLAGSPTGVFIDNNSRAWQLVSYVLWKAGLSRAASFNFFILVVHLLAPFALLAAARLFGLGRWPALMSFVAGYCLWNFDGFVHFQWWEGSPAYAMICYLVPLNLALAYRWTVDKKLIFCTLLALTMALTTLVHSFAVFALIIPFGFIYVVRRAELETKHHLLTLLVVAATVAINAKWIWLRMGFAHLSNDTTTLGLGTISHLFTDFLGLTSDTRVSGGVALRSAFRFLFFGAAAVTLVLWRRDRDTRFSLFAVGLISLTAAAYFGGYLFGLGGIQPYRFIGPAMFLAIIPAAELVDEVRRRGALNDLPRLAYAVLVLIVLASIPRLARDVAYFTPALAPGPEDLPPEKPHISDIIGFGSIGYPRHRDYRHKVSPDDFATVANWLKQWKPEHGRVVVEYGPLAEHLAWRTKAYILGGSRSRPNEYRAADFFHTYPQRDPGVKDIAAYLERYAVGVAVVNANISPGETDYVERLINLPTLFKPLGHKKPFRILHSILPVSYFAKGSSGKVEATTNRILVSGTQPNEDLVLKFHYMEQLKCLPDCKIEKSEVEGDPIGFIGIPAPHPADFEIQNKY